MGVLVVIIKHIELMKKNLLLLFSLFLVSQIGFSQEKEINPQLLSVYTETELNQMIQNDHDKYDLLVYAIDNGIYTTTYPKGKKVENSISVPVGDFNFLDLNLKIQETNQYFRINGIEKVVVVKSFFVLNNEIKTK